jgi:hypothetical protein
MDFNVSDKFRTTDNLSNYQLFQVTSKLEEQVDDLWEVNFILGNALPISLQDYEPTTYVKQSKPRFIKKRDELLVYSGFLSRINAYLGSTPEAIDDVHRFLATEVKKISDMSKKPQATSQSELFKELILNSSFSEKKNPSEYLRKKGSHLYDLVKSDGPVSGNRLIVEKNYEQVLKIK